MKRNFSCMLALFALLLVVSCKKSINSTVDLSQTARGGFAPDPLWQTPASSTRLIRFDIGDGYGSDCVFAYDVVTGHVSLNEFNGTNSTQIYAGTGIPTTNVGAISVTTGNNQISDNFNEVGGVHIISLDYSGTGRENYLLVYVPGVGNWYFLSYAGNGKWTQQSSGTGGIYGYDLHATYDKIIAYDFNNTGHKKDLICYRPSGGNFWVLENTGNAANPFTAVVKSSGGVGGYDLKGYTDQLVADEGVTDGGCDIIAYRPGYGYVYWLVHASAGNSNWSPAYISRSGWENFPLSHYQDRGIAFQEEYSYYGGDYNQDGEGLWYSPGNHYSGSDWDYFYQTDGGFVVGNFQVVLQNWPFNYNPYSTGNTLNVGDHVLRFSAGYQTSNTTIPNAMLMYTNGAIQSQLYEGIGGEVAYTEVY
jgi:hypothetical protein